MHHLDLEKREKLSTSEQFTCATCAIFTECARLCVGYTALKVLGWDDP